MHMSQLALYKQLMITFVNLALCAMYLPESPGFWGSFHANSDNICIVMSLSSRPVYISILVSPITMQKATYVTIHWRHVLEDR